MVDWGTSAWAKSVEAAQEQASDWLIQVGQAKGWSVSQAKQGQTLINAAAEDADTAIAFWGALVASARLQEGAPDGWDKLVATWESATDTAATVEQAQKDATTGAILEGALEGIRGDLEKGAQVTRKWGPWVLGGLAIGGVFYAAWRLTR